MEKIERDFGLDILKFIACILIVNSHCDLAYPKKLGFLATGGSLGNSIFFLVSGYCLVECINSNFINWYGKRIKRIYPQVIVTSFLLMLFNPIELTVNSILKYYLYPTQFWFISAIIVFYVLYYILIKVNAKLNSKNILSWSLGILTIIYFVCYIFFIDKSVWAIEDSGYFKWIFYFQIMILGAYIKLYIPQTKVELGRIKNIIILLSLLGFYFVFKYALLKLPVLMKIQFIVQIISFPIMYYFIQVFSVKYYIGRISKLPYIKKIIDFTANLTLEVYLVQFIVIETFKDILFPINIIIIYIGTFLLAYIVDRICKTLMRFIF